MTAITQDQLIGRTAKCSCGRTEPSDFNLAFFEYRGEGSRVAQVRCGTCAYHDVAHERAKNDPTATHLKRILDHEFHPIGALDHDIFYCGCRGWD